MPRGCRRAPPARDLRVSRDARTFNDAEDDGMYEAAAGGRKWSVVPGAAIRSRVRGTGMGVRG